MAHGDQINPRMLLVINMDSSVTTNDLYAHFKDAGEVIWARVTDEIYVKSVAQGYVSFAKPEDGTSSFSYHLFSILGIVFTYVSNSTHGLIVN